MLLWGAGVQHWTITAGELVACAVRWIVGGQRVRAGVVSRGVRLYVPPLLQPPALQGVQVHNRHNRPL